MPRRRTTYVQGDRNSNHDEVKVEQTVVLRQAVGDESSADEVDEVKVQSSIDDAEQGFLNPIKDVVDPHEGVVDLKGSRCPDAGNSNVDANQEEERPPLDLRDKPLVIG